MQKYTALILARANSSRIKNKNFIYFYGKPMFTWSVNAILKTKIFNKIFLSTDNDKIFLKDNRICQVFKRNKKNASKFATTADAVLEFIKKSKNIIDQKYLLVVYGCAPFIKKNEILRGLNLIKKKNFDSLFPVVENEIPLEKNLFIFKGKIKPIYIKKFNNNNQNLPKVYKDAGQWYLINIKKFLVKKKILTKNSGFIILKSEDCHDINYYNDLRIAKLKFKKLITKS
jgi:N-acylneuraminate cytidylyltransferase